MNLNKKYSLTLLALFYFSPLFAVAALLENYRVFIFALIAWYGIGFASFSFLFFRLKTAEKIKEQDRSLVDVNQNLQRELENLKKSQNNFSHEFLIANKELQDSVDKKESILSEYRSTLKDQRLVIEKKQEEVNVLQIKINDLKYEVENLLKLKNEPIESEKHWLAQPEISDSEKNHQTRSLLKSVEGKLNHYAKLAIELNQSNLFSNSPSLLANFGLSHLAIDQRRFFDCLQSEEEDVVVVYSKPEKRFIFISQQIRDLLGYSSDKCQRDFMSFIQKGSEFLQQAFDHEAYSEAASIPLLMKTKSGKDVLTHCQLKEISQGTFKNHILGILTIASKA